MIRNASLTILVFLACGCSPGPKEPDGPGSFRIKSLGATKDGASRYVATAGTCRFELQINQGRPTSDARFSFADASLLRQPGADCTAFLHGLATLLEFKGELPTPALAEKVPATIAVLGANLSRKQDTGSFSAKPPGHWMATKLFLADGDGEVYLNINP